MKNFKILIEPQIFWYQRFGGISRYFVELMIYFEKNDIRFLFPIAIHENKHLEQKKLCPNSNFAKILLKLGFKGAGRLRSIFFSNSRSSKNCMLKDQYDIVLATYYDTYFLDLIGNRPLVLTVYDMIHELYPNAVDRDNVIVRKKRLMNQAAMIIAISEQTKSDILRLNAHIEPEKIKVVYLSQSIDTTQDLANVKLPENYILFVGSRDGYKNFLFFIESVRPLLKSDQSLHVVCAGGPPFTPAETELFLKEEIENQVLHNQFEDYELAAYYKRAKCFVFPSEYEGFGIPVLEAMACGCPIVLPYHSSFPEVAGEAGIFYKLNDPKDLLDKVKDVMDYSVKQRDEVVKKGVDQAKRFSWELTARQVLEVCEGVISNRRKQQVTS